MPTRPRQLLLHKSARPILADAGRMANENPDSLARKLLRSRSFSKSNRHKGEIWRLLQDLGSDAAVKRASRTIAKNRSTPELLCALNAAEADLWFETGPAIIKRFDSEFKRIGIRAPAKDLIARIEALCTAASRLKVELDVQALRKLLKHSSARLRAIAAAYAQKMNGAELVGALLPVSWEEGPGALCAESAVREFGDGACAAALWPRALAARKAGRGEVLHRHLRLLGALGAFDILIALRVWIEEDFAQSEAEGWRFAEAWSALVRAKVASGDATRDEALGELRWFLHTAEKSAIPEARLEGEGVFHLACGFALLNAPDEAERLALRASKRSLPNPEKFPELLPLALHAGVNHPAPTAWLAAAGDPEAQRKIVENWPVLLREGRRPLNWDLREKLDSSVLRDTLREALHVETPGAARQVLKFLCGDAAALVVRDEIERIAAEHPSSVVRWKARRAAAGMNANRGETGVSKPAKWTRLDAAVLTGALKKISEARPVSKPVEKSCPGLLPPERPGQGWKINIENLRPAARRALVKALLAAPLPRALHRRAPLGPAYEERPDVRAVRELAPAGNTVDEQMSEMARAVMEFWIYGDEQLTLELNGISQVAAFLSSGGIAMDEDDVMACGAFIGEAMRKRFGGAWNGFDGNYSLEIGGETFDPIGLAKRLFERKDALQGPVLASEMYLGAEARLVPAKKQRVPRDTGASFERAIRNLCELPVKAPMSALMAETRVFSYRMEPNDWLAVLAACDPLLDNSSGARIAAAIAIYAPGDALARAWARWGAKRRDASGLAHFMADAMRTAAGRDDLEAMPNWTVQVPATRFSFLNALRKRMTAKDWRSVLLLLLRQRTAAGDVSGTGWCLFSYKYECPDCLPLMQAFCEMTVASRQTLLRATRHCTRDEVKLFRPVWAESLRDPSPAVVLAALDAAGFNRAKSLRPHVEALKHDSRSGIASAAVLVLDSFNTK